MCSNIVCILQSLLNLKGIGLTAKVDESLFKWKLKLFYKVFRIAIVFNLRLLVFLHLLDGWSGMEYLYTISVE